MISRLKLAFIQLVLVTVLLYPAVLGVRPAFADEPDSQKAKYLVIIVIDPCRPDYLSLARTPNIDSLKAAGINYTNSWVGQLCNDTPPGHTSISTGCFPVNTGVISFSWREERFMPSDWKSQVSLYSDIFNFIKTSGWTDLGLWLQKSVFRKSIEEKYATSWQNVTTGEFTDIIRKSKVGSIGMLYKKAHPEAKVAAVSGDKWYAAAGLAADSADVVVFNDSTGIPPVTYNSAKKLKPAGLNALPLPSYISNDAAFIRKVEDECDIDIWATDISLALIEKMQPEIMLINLPATDDAGHSIDIAKKPEVMGRVIANADRQIGRIIDAYKRAGKFDNTLFVLLSDHAMTPVTQIISQDRLDRIYIESGSAASYSSHVYLLNQGKAKEIAEKITAAGMPGIHGAYYKVAGMDGSYIYKPTASTSVAITEDVNNAFLYLLSTYAGEKSPDIELIIAENCHIDFKTTDGKTFYSNHVSTSWENQHIMLLIAGPGVKKGIESDSPARLVDIAPTLLTLNGIRPVNMDGTILADALQKPADFQRVDQEALNKKLMPYIKSLKALSSSDINNLGK